MLKPLLRGGFRNASATNRRTSQTRMESEQDPVEEPDKDDDWGCNTRKSVDET
jgi:hypothetical protein